MTAGGAARAARLPELRRLMTGLRRRLLLILLLPFAGIYGVIAWRDYAREAAADRTAALVLHEATAARASAEMDVVEEMLLAVAGRTELLAMPPEACDAALRAAHDLFGQRYADVWILDGDGQLRCSAAPVQRGIDPRDLPNLRDVQTIRPHTVGWFSIGLLSGRPVLPAATPVLTSDGGLQAVVGATVVLDQLFSPGHAASIAGAQYTWLIDRTGAAVSVTGAPAAALPDAGTLERMARGGVRTAEGDARSGEPHAWTVAVLRPDLLLLAGVPMDGLRLAALRVGSIELAGVMLGSLIVVLIGLEFSVVRPLRRLAARVRAWSPGQPFAATGDGQSLPEVREIDTAMLAASDAIIAREAALRDARRQHDLAMEAVNHRVHNNLQIVASLLNMQANGSVQPEVRTELVVVRDRVRALAALYRHVSRGLDPRGITLGPYIEELCRQLAPIVCVASNADVAMAIEIDDMDLRADQAGSLVLLITEAVTNALQHAFPAGRPGTITVYLRRQGEGARLVVSDDGVGLPKNMELRDAPGVKLVRAFAEHLGGTALISGQDGTLISVLFSDRNSLAGR